MYLVTLNGIGEVQLLLVDKEIWDYINDGTPVSEKYLKAAKSNSYDDADYESFLIDYEDSCGHGEPAIDRGNWNDRALIASWFVPQQTFSEVSECTKYIMKNKIEILSEIEGVIY